MCIITVAAYKFPASTTGGQLLGRSNLALCHELRLVCTLWNHQATFFHALPLAVHNDARLDTKNLGSIIFATDQIEAKILINIHVPDDLNPLCYLREIRRAKSPLL